MNRFLMRFVALAGIVTVLCLLVDIAVQQNFRQSANDPQIQMAEDAAMKLANGASVKEVVPLETVEISQSLAPYVIYFDDTGKPVLGSGILHGNLPVIPAGIFDVVRSQGEDRFTWQPEPDVRSAVVVTRVSGNHPGFVLAGRSLREVEIRENKLSLQVGAAWIVSLALALAAAAP